MNSMELKQSTFKSNEAVRQTLKKIETITSYLPRYTLGADEFEINYIGISPAIGQAKATIDIDIPARENAFALLGRFCPVSMYMDSEKGDKPFVADYHGISESESLRGNRIFPARFIYDTQTNLAHLSWFYHLKEFNSGIEIRAFISAESLYVQTEGSDFVLSNFPDKSRVIPYGFGGYVRFVSFWKFSFWEGGIEEFKKCFLQKAEIRVSSEGVNR
jgi:hypothetical protein